MGEYDISIDDLLAGNTGTKKETKLEKLILNIYTHTGYDDTKKELARLKEEKKELDKKRFATQKHAQITYSSATVVFKGRGKSLDFIGFLGWKDRIYTLVTSLEDRIDNQDI